MALLRPRRAWPHASIAAADEAIAKAGIANTTGTARPAGQQRNDQPEGARRLVAVNEEGQHQTRAHDQQPSVGDPILQPAPSLMGGLPILQPRLVFRSHILLEQLLFLGIIPHVLTRPAMVRKKSLTVADWYPPLKPVSVCSSWRGTEWTGPQFAVSLGIQGQSRIRSCERTGHRDALSLATMVFFLL